MTAATAVPDGSEAAGRLNHDFSVIALLQNFTTGQARMRACSRSGKSASIQSPCDGSGDDCSVTAPFRPSVSTLAVPAAMSCQNRFDDGDIASMVELPENRQPLVGTEEQVFSRPPRNVTIERQLDALRGKPRARTSPGGERCRNWRVKSKALASRDRR